LYAIFFVTFFFFCASWTSFIRSAHHTTVLFISNPKMNSKLVKTVQTRLYTSPPLRTFGVQQWLSLRGSLRAIHQNSSRFHSILITVKASNNSENREGAQLAAEFARIINEGGEQATYRMPSHLLSPRAAVSCIMEALQRKDWPDTNSGLKVAYEFTKRNPEDELTPMPSPPQVRRSWEGQERWLDPKEFESHLILSAYNAMLECDRWNLTGPLTFPSSRSETRAVQVVRLEKFGRSYTFSFCLERAAEGSLKGCWLVAGVRQGDYSV